VIVTHLGNGVVTFKDIINITNDASIDWLSRVESGCTPQQYVEIDGDSERNVGGYEFSKDSYDTRPTRFDRFDHNALTETDKKFKELVDNSIYFAVVNYGKIFPASVSELTFKTDGHIAKYEPNQYIGHHSDCAIPYERNSFNPIHMAPLYNTLTVSVAMNDNYEGGELHFKTWGITVKAPVGTITVYPSNFMGAHEVLPVTSGVRYSYLGWFCHGDNSNKSMLLQDLQKDCQQITGFDFDYVPVGVIS